MKVVCKKCGKLFDDKIYDELKYKFDIKVIRNYCNECIDELWKVRLK